MALNRYHQKPRIFIESACAFLMFFCCFGAPASANAGFGDVFSGIGSIPRQFVEGAAIAQKEVLPGFFNPSSLASVFNDIKCFFGFNCSAPAATAPVPVETPNSKNQIPNNNQSSNNQETQSKSSEIENQIPQAEIDRLTIAPVQKPQVTQIIQPTREIQTIHTITNNTSTIIADQDTKNKVEQILRQLDSDRPNYSLGQSFSIPANLGVAWGNIAGTFARQLDLKTALDAKQNLLTADTDYLTPATASSTYQAKGIYLTSYTETDPIFSAWDKTTGVFVTESQITDLQDYLTAETDPIFASSTAALITNTNVGNWNTAYGWGDHSLIGYLTATSTLAAANVAQTSSYRFVTDAEKSIWNAKQNSLVADVDYLTPATASSTYQPRGAYLTSFTETDPLFSAWDKTTGVFVTESQITDLQDYLTAETDPVFASSTAASITTTNVNNWNTAFGWGNWRHTTLLGYGITDALGINDTAAAVIGFSPTAGKTLTLNKSMTLTSSDDTSVITFPAGTKTLLATDGSGSSLTNLTAGNLSGTISSGVLGNSSLYLGSTAIALNRGTGSIALTGITSIDGSAASAATATAATTATRLAAAKNINGTAFDGSADITVTADANTLTGTTLNSSVVTSSLTSMGTLANLTVTNPISGSVTGNAATVTNGVYTNAANSFSFPNPLTTISESWIGPSSTAGIYFKGGSVGIGTTDPGAKLDVVGGNIRTDNQLVSTLAVGTAPLAVTSTTKVANLNADYLDGLDGSTFTSGINDIKAKVSSEIGLPVFGGNGSDGAGPASGALDSTIKQYTDWTITGAITSSETGPTGLFVGVSGTLTIENGGSVSVDGKGQAGGIGGNVCTIGNSCAGIGNRSAGPCIAGAAGGGAGAGSGYGGCSGGGGGSAGGSPGPIGTSGYTATATATAKISAMKLVKQDIFYTQVFSYYTTSGTYYYSAGTGLLGGAGGGGAGVAGADGGAGGGVIYIEANSIVVNPATAVITANGFSGLVASSSGAGGGGGGIVWIRAKSLTGVNSTTVTAVGGAGGNSTRSGGAGVAGAVIIEKVN